MAMILAYTVSMTGVRRKLRHSLGFLLRVDGGEFWYTRMDRRPATLKANGNSKTARG